jgi:hypothetical protein
VDEISWDAGSGRPEQLHRVDVLPVLQDDVERDGASVPTLPEELRRRRRVSAVERKSTQR